MAKSRQGGLRAKATRTSRPQAAGGGKKPPPPTARPPARERREPSQPAGPQKKFGRTLDAMPDRIDIRDWFYQPRLVPLPDQVINHHLVPHILDQGREGACTGFALAAVIQFLLARRDISDRLISPRMLYE